MYMYAHLARVDYKVQVLAQHALAVPTTMGLPFSAHLASTACLSDQVRSPALWTHRYSVLNHMAIILGRQAARCALPERSMMVLVATASRVPLQPWAPPPVMQT